MAALWRLVQIVSELACLAPLTVRLPGRLRTADEVGTRLSPQPKPEEEATQDS